MSDNIEENVQDKGNAFLISDDDRHTIFEWTVRDCSSIRSTSVLKSETFVMVQNPKIKWRLVLKKSYDNFCEDCSTYYVQFYLENCKADKNPVSLDVSISILDAMNEKTFTQRETISGIILATHNYGCNLRIQFSQLQYFSVNKNLKILCEIKNTSDSILENLRVLKGYKSFINNEHFSDIVLYVGEQAIHAHKIILASKSSYFNKMFSSNAKDFKISESKVKDIEPEVFMELLKYMYTGRVEKLDKLALQIFKAAHFYEIDDLKEICEQVLIKNICIENAIESLKLADDYNVKKMKENCISFIVQQFKTVMKCTDVKGLIKTHPHLPFELLIEMGSK